MYYVEVERGETIEVLHKQTSSNRKLYSGQISLVLNAVSEFVFSILYSHPLFTSDFIQPYSTLIRVKDESGATIFTGRVVDPVLKMTEDGLLVKEYYAEDELAFLLDSIQYVNEFHNITPSDYLNNILANHNEFLAFDSIDKSIYLGNVDVTNSTDSLYRYTAYESSLKNIKDDLIDSLGGYIKIRHGDDGKRYLDYTVESGITSEMSIALAKNLKSIESKYMPSNIITRLIPLGAEYESVTFAIYKLYNSGLITSTSYWLETYESLTFLAQLLINLSKLPYNSSVNNGITAIDKAIDFLNEAGAINSPDYWKENYSKVSSLSTLLINAAKKYDTSDQTTTADASKPRLTIESVNNGKAWLDDNELIEKYGIIMGFKVWEDVTIPSNLYKKADVWLSSQTLTNSVSISALDLSLIDKHVYEKFVIGNQYRAKNELLGIDETYRLIEQSIDIVNLSESTLTFGDNTKLISNRPVG